MCKILIVDDEKINRRIASKMLSENYEIAEAESAAAAYEYLEGDTPDLVLLDVHMPEVDGYEVIRTMKAKDDWKDIPVVFLTADNDDEAEVTGFRAGAVDFLTKPFKRDVIIERIEKIVGDIKRTKDLQKEVDLQTSIARQQRKIIDTLEWRPERSDKDELTGFLRRESGRIAIAQAMVANKGCFAFLDVDNLKTINDTHGHLKGDQLLRTVADCIRDHAGDGVLCRLGGDEFLIFISDISTNRAEEIMNSIIEGFALKKKEDEFLKVASISAGLVMTNPGDDYETVLRNADKALYYVKQNGKGSYSFFRDKAWAEADEEEINLDRLASGLSIGGAYDGALEVEYRVFQRLYGYLVHVGKRYDREIKLVLLTVIPEKNEAAISDSDIENYVNNLCDSIKHEIRAVDIYTRMSGRKILLLMRESIEGGVDIALNRMRNYHNVNYGQDKIKIDTKIVNVVYADDF